MFKKVHVIINPAAGQEEPILSYINSEFNRKNITWDISITHQAGDATKQALQALKKKVDLICVYGGDGTVMEVAKALFKKSKPMAIIPGGTANVMAKELGIPINSLEAIKMIANKNHKLQTIDMALCNKEPFFLRISIGRLAKFVKDTSREMKDTFGQAAYGISAVKHFGKEDNTEYKIVLDGKRFTEKGAALMITNSGNVGIEGLSLIPSISVSDGLLDIILFKDTNLTTMASLATSMLLQNKPTGIVQHWKGRKIKVTFPTKSPIILDDASLKAKSISVSIVPHSLRIVVPKRRII